MSLLTSVRSCLLAATALAPAVLGQNSAPPPAGWLDPQISQGLFANLPVGLSVKSGSQSNLWIRAAGTNGGVPTTWSGPVFGAASDVHPDYSMTALCQSWALPGTTPEFGGISTGGDVTPPVTSLGELQMGSEVWYMLSIVVDSVAVGQPGSLLRQRTNSGRNPAGDIMSYYVQGSTGINTALVDKVCIEYTSEQLALQQALPPGSPTPAVVNHDFAMGVISKNPRGRDMAMFPVRDRFYFTLTRNYLLSGLAPASIGGLPPSASTIYCMTWQTTSLRWSAPVIAFTHNELFPDIPTEPPATQLLEIDALSVYFEATTGIERVVFSLTPDSDNCWPVGIDQILVHQRGPNPWHMVPTQALKTQSGLKVSERFGLKPRKVPTAGDNGTPDNVKSTCGGDPKDTWVIPEAMGLATDEPRMGQSKLGLTAVRHTDPGSPLPANDRLFVQVTGLNQGGFDFGFVCLFVETPSGPALIAMSNLINDAMKYRNAVDFEFQVPATPMQTPFRISAEIRGINLSQPQTPTVLRESWLLDVRL
ncbi:MAG: hypothetical protein NTV21_20605 [Planctomycetota bacterium]|nr:hypothetical protein [Planctomycetota bacterium]